MFKKSLTKERLLFLLDSKSRFKKYLIRDLSKEDYLYLLDKKLKIKKGDIIFVHSAIGRLKLGFDISEAIDILLDKIGDEGTFMVPTFPKKVSEKFIKDKDMFSLNDTKSGTGLLTEEVRLRNNAVRSLHPIKSCAAIGKDAEYLLKDHHKSLLPYDRRSPFFKLAELGGKVIGLGVSSWIFSFQHCVPDTYSDYPVKIHSDKSYDVVCTDKEGQEIIVSTPYDLGDIIIQRNYSLIRKYFKNDEWFDFKYKQRYFYIVDAKKYYDKCVKLASKKIVMYPKNLFRL